MKSVHPIRRFVLAGIISILIFAFIVQVALAATLTVTPLNTQGWQIIPDGTVPVSFDLGPGTPPSGVGSVQFGPIDGSVGANKFIMVAPVIGMPTSEFASLAYHLYVDAASGLSVQHMYVNVYVDTAANGIGVYPPGRWYDCRFDYVPSGATGTWVSAGFNSAFTGWAGFTNYAGCANSIGAQAAGSVIMRVVFNGGQSNASDAGLQGAFDNITIATSGGSDTYDFEPPVTIDPVTGKRIVITYLPFTDGRINNYDHGAPVAAYPHDAGKEHRGFIVYEVFESSQGVFAMVVSPEELAAVPEKPQQNTLIAEAETDRMSMTFWRLASGEFQLNVIRPGGKTYVLRFTDLIPGGGGYTSFEYD